MPPLLRGCSTLPMTATEAPEAERAVARMSVPTLTAMVVGSRVGAGAFSLPARFGVATGVLGSLPRASGWRPAGSAL